MATQDPNTPKYDTKTGFITDYGKYLGLKPVQKGDPAFGSSAPKTNLQTGGDSSDFMKGIQEKLLGQSGIISSTNSNLESRINAAISGVESSRKATGKAIESAYDREADFQSEQGALGIQNQLEGRVGFATQMVAFRNLVSTTDKSLKDLEQRKQELLLQNDSAAASKIADLQFKALEFQQQAQQQTFSNLLGIANFGLQSAQEKRLNDQNTLAEKKAISDIALQYGLQVNPGDTIDSITSKAMVFASEEQKARLAKLQSEIKYTNAQTAHILTGDKNSNTVKITPSITDKLALRWKELSDQGLTVDTSAEMQNILGKYAKTGQEADFYDAIGNLSIEQAKAQMEAKKATVAKPNPSGEKGLPGAILDFQIGAKNTTQSFLNWLIGK